MTGMEGALASDNAGNLVEILLDEVNVIASELIDAHHDERPVDLGMLRTALVLIAATATAWADSIKPPPATKYCDDKFNSGGFVFWHCTLPINHPGNHAYVNGDGDVLAMWPNSTRKVNP